MIKGDGAEPLDECLLFPEGRYAESGAASVAAGDFDGDGVLDLAVANSGGGVSVLLGLGNGSFAPEQRFGAGLSSKSVAVGDFDGDGVLDLAVVSSSPDVSVLLGLGDGSFAPEQRFGAGVGARSVAVGDFDGDDVQDLAVAASTGFSEPDSDRVSVLLGLGDGSFAAQQRISVGFRPSSVAVGDFDGDGVEHSESSLWHHARTRRRPPRHAGDSAAD